MTSKFQSLSIRSNFFLQIETEKRFGNKSAHGKNPFVLMINGSWEGVLSKIKKKIKSA